jgi:hypothetical protein
MNRLLVVKEICRVVVSTERLGGRARLMSGFEYLNRGVELSLKPVSAVEAFALVVVVQVSVDETQRSAFVSSLRPTRCLPLMLFDRLGC